VSYHSHGETIETCNTIWNFICRFHKSKRDM